MPGRPAQSFRFFRRTRRVWVGAMRRTGVCRFERTAITSSWLRPRFPSSPFNLLYLFFLLLLSGISGSALAASCLPALGSVCNGTEYAEGPASCGSELVCDLNVTSLTFGHCVGCQNDEQCIQTHEEVSACFPLTSCNASVSVCRHKELFGNQPLHWLDIVSSLVLLFGGMFAAGGGVGGGGVFVPVLILVARFQSSAAIPLSNALILGASMANWAQTGIKRHPFSDRPLIDYDLALMLQPLALAGVVIGVLLNAAFPEWLTLILLVIVLVFNSYKTLKKGIALHKREVVEATKQANEARVEELMPLSTTGSHEEDASSDIRSAEGLYAVEDAARSSRDNSTCAFDSHSSSSSRSSDKFDQEGEHFDIEAVSDSHSSATALPVASAASSSSRRHSSPTMASSTATIADNNSDGAKYSIEALALLERERKTPWGKIALLFVVLILSSGTSLLRGGKADSPLGISVCSTSYWLLTFTPLALLAFLSVCIGRMMIRDWRIRVDMDYPWAEGDLQWTVKRTYVVAGVSFVAGILASLLGIGGGMILSPLMLEMHVLPDVTASTSSFMILFTSASSVAQFIAVGRMPWGYGLWYGFIGLLSSVLGQTALNYVVNKYNKKSAIVFSIAIVIGLSTILLLVTGTINVVELIRAERSEELSFVDICRR